MVDNSGMQLGLKLEFDVQGSKFINLVAKLAPAPGKVHCSRFKVRIMNFTNSAQPIVNLFL